MTVTNHSAGPERPIIKQDPGLLGEPDAGFLLLYSCPCSYWRQNVVYDSAAHACEDNDPVEDEADIVPAQSMHSCCFIVVRYTEELLGMMSGWGKEDVCEEKCRKEVEGNACGALAECRMSYVGERTDLMVDYPCASKRNCALLFAFGPPSWHCCLLRGRGIMLTVFNCHGAAHGGLFLIHLPRSLGLSGYGKNGVSCQQSTSRCRSGLGRTSGVRRLGVGWLQGMTLRICHCRLQIFDKRRTLDRVIMTD